VQKKIFQSESVIATKAPYSQAVIYENLLFISGIVAYDPKTNSAIKGSIEEEAQMTLNILKAIVEEAGTSLKNVLKVSVFLTDIKEFEKFNSVYEKFFTESHPARSCVEVQNLPFNAKVEIEAIAHI
jgi:2-iminobutanoate/2-iminopropanoate deaminase